MIRGDFHQPTTSAGPARYILAVLAVALFVRPTPALGAPPPEARPLRRVLLVSDKPSDPFVDRIRAELTSLGLSVIARGPVGPLEADARDQRAIAAIRVLPSRKGVEVWMADETSGRSLLRQVIVDESPGGPNQGLVALQTAELLRTSLFPRQDKPPQPPGAQIVVVPSAPVVEPHREAAPSREVGVQAGLGLLYSAGGAGSALQAWLSLHQQLAGRWALALGLSAPLARATLNGPEGRADLGVFLAGAELHASFETREPRLFLTTGVGTALAWVSARGQATAPQVATSASAFAGLGYARVDAGWRASEWLSFGVSAALGATFGRVNVRFAGSDAGTWGLPILASFLISEVHWN